MRLDVHAMNDIVATQCCSMQAETNLDSQVKHDLDVLAAVERGEAISQLALSKRVGIAVGLVNAIMKRAVRKGYIKVTTAPAKRYAYYLTPRGFSQKCQLVAEYLHDSLGFFRIARREYTQLFERLKAMPSARVALVGGGELAEIALMSAEEAGVPLVGIVAPKGAMPVRFGHAVSRRLSDLGPVDFAVVTAMSDPQDVYDKLVKELGPSRVLVPPMLHVLPAAQA